MQEHAPGRVEGGTAVRSTCPVSRFCTLYTLVWRSHMMVFNISPKCSLVNLYRYNRHSGLMMVGGAGSSDAEHTILNTSHPGM